MVPVGLAAVGDVKCDPAFALAGAPDPSVLVNRVSSKRTGMSIDFQALPAMNRLSYVETRYVPAVPGPPAAAVRCPGSAVHDARVIVIPDYESASVKGTFGIVIDFAVGEVAKLAAIPRVGASMGYQVPSLLTDEAVLLSRLDHPNVVKLFRTYVCENTTACEHVEDKFMACHVMEKMDYDLLKFTVALRKRTASDDVKWVLGRVIERDCLYGLRYLHSRGYLHKDVKPGNILLGPANGRYPASIVAKLADFGAASNGPTQNVMGTKRYLAPECLSPQIQLQASDVWALYASLFEYYTGGISIFHRSDEPSKLKEGYARMFRVMGTAKNPIDTYAGRHAEYISPRDVRRKAPDWDDYLDRFWAENVKRMPVGTRRPEQFLGVMKAVMQLEPAARPSAAQILERLDAYFTGISLPPPSRNRPSKALPGAIRLVVNNASSSRRTFDSRWYVERGAPRDSDAFVKKGLFGVRSSPSASSSLVHYQLSPLALLYPTGIDGATADKFPKPPRILDERDLVATGHGYFLFKWNDSTLVYSVVVPVINEPAFWSRLRNFCESVLASGAEPEMPLSEYFLEVLGPSAVVSFVLNGDVRHIGSVEHNDAAAYARLLKGMYTLAANARCKITATSLLSSIWCSYPSEGTTDVVYHINFVSMFREYMGALTFKECLAGVGYPSRDITSDLVWAIVKRFLQPLADDRERAFDPAAFIDKWQPLCSSASADMRSVLSAMTDLDYVAPRRSHYPRVSESPRIRMIVIDTAMNETAA